jgi:hypothetical protein
MSSRFSIFRHIEPHAIRSMADSHPRLRHLADVLVEKHGLSRERAKNFVERLITVVLNDFGETYTGEMSARLDRVVKLREKVTGIYESTINGKGLPDGVTPSSVEGMFRELQREMNELHSPTRAAEEGRLPKHDDIVSQMVSSHSDEPLTPDAEPGSLFDPYPSEPRFRRRGPERGGDDVLLASAWRDEVMPTTTSRLGRTPGGRGLRERFRQGVVEPFVQKFLPPGSKAQISSLDITQTAVREAVERLGSNDLFIPHGAEVQFTIHGETFRPDGVRFVDSAQKRYVFREHKEPLTLQEGSFFNSDEGRMFIRRKLMDHARIADTCSSHGCVGYEWTSGQSWLDNIIAEEIGAIRSDSDPNVSRLGRRYLSLSPGE